MGFAECNFAMESRTGSVSSGLGSRSGVRGQSVKSSPFCPRSSSKMTQSIVRDHMVSHYKKVYSAKAAVDASVPKSITFSVKYNDQIRQDRLRKGGRPQSAHSLSQRNSRASSSSSQSTLSVQYDDNLYLCSRSSMVSSPRFNTSFHAKEIVYQSCKRDLSHHTRSASEFKFHSPESALHRKHSACSLAASGGQSCYKTFQDPIQKTYSGDILQKHSQHFTQEKPFTPKTLKSEKSSYLEKYRYYRAPRRKITQDSTSSKLMRQETNHRSTKTKEYTQDFDEPSQGFTTDHEWSEDEFNGTYLSESRQQSQLNKSRERYLFNSSSRFSQECVKSPLMKKISAEEEELMYLEFISAVTEDILSRGHISDRVLDRVTMHHIEMNRHQLDEGKMRHLLVVLRKDFEEPANTSTSTAELEKKENGLLDSLLPYLESGRKQVKTKDSDMLPYASLIKISDSLDYTDALSVSATLRSPERTASPTKTNETDKEDDKEKCTGSENVSGVSEEDVQHNQPDTTATNEEISNENHEKTTITSDEEFHQDQAEVSHDDGQSKELEDLGRRLSESLHVSSNTNSHDPDAANEQHENTVASVSDDEF
ncbi:spermatogenesis-associated protein 7 homolog isoform X1 [Hippoglossus hippoglossus]|uniref:spermatogenesis-associated protein 7 homolog isoform X1 n=1 Tax=Hippoglossus hippoglossus TaxID=8267 RepID=UPI00148E04A7|nr:spermatogenesis-associated protein 7 homolog isoform X1 [Hippoglossus hippoglossus]